MLKRHVYPTPDALFEYVACELERYSLMPVSQHICLAGGSTAKALFSYIVASDYRFSIHWKNLHFWWGDERCVPANHSQSNYGQAKQALFDHISIPHDHIHPIISEELSEGSDALSGAACQRALDQFNLKLNQLLEVQSPLHDALAHPKFDWILLGVGEDGHTASLFPGETDLDAHENALLVTKPGTVEKRISLSANCIASARRVSFMVSGKSKARVVADIFEHAEGASAYPAALVRSRSGETDYYLDQDAASILINC
jgi:6-phosphogluconolactonase